MNNRQSWGFRKTCAELVRRTFQHTILLLGGAVVGALSFILGLFGISLTVPTLISAIGLGGAVILAIVKAFQSVLEERDEAVSQRDSARAERNAAGTVVVAPRMPPDVLARLGQLLRKSNLLFAEQLKSKEELNAWQQRVEGWVTEVEEVLKANAPDHDHALFVNIAGRASMRYANELNDTHGRILNNLNSFRQNLEHLIKAYR